MNSIFRFERFFAFLLLLHLILYGVSSSNAASLTWQNATAYPIPIFDEVALVGQDSFIYAFGGNNFSGTATSISFKFNSTSQEWIEIKPMPYPASSTTGCVANDGRMFIFGLTGYIQIYSPMDDIWNTTVVSGYSFEDVLMSCAVDSSTGLMYITGGQSIPTRFYCYNVSSNTVTDLYTSNYPLSGWGHGSFVADNGYLYLFGGFSSTQGIYTTNCFAYQISTGGWFTATSMLRGAAWFGYATDGSRFYAIGGSNNTGTSHLLEYTQVYDIYSNVWSLDTGIVLSGGIYAGAAVYLNGDLRLIGGLDSGYLSVQRVALLCGVYSFSGSCDDLNQCTGNDVCNSNGECVGTCLQVPGCDCSSSSTIFPPTLIFTSMTMTTSTIVWLVFFYWF